MIRFALCDDNAQLLSKLKEMLELIFLQKDIEASVVYSTNNPNSLISFVSQSKIDVLFLDIDLNSHLNGIDIAKEIRKKNKSIYIIFITGHFEYILSAFECKTFDFIQKPLSYSKLEKTLSRLFDDINCNTINFIKLNNKHKLVNQNLVNFIQKDGMKIIYNLESGTIDSYGSFNKLIEDIPNNFIRCHKSFIVNIDNISSVNFKNDSISFGNSPTSICYIGPKYKKNFMEVLNNYGNIK